MKSQEYSLRVRPAPLHGGTLSINGYKHAMVQVICAAVATGRQVHISNAPAVHDTGVMAEIFAASGGHAVENSGWLFDATSYNDPRVDPALSRKIHGSLYLMPALATRFDRFEFAEGGGCQIGEGGGARPVMHMLDVMERFGTRCRVTASGIYGERVESPALVQLDMCSYSDSPTQLTGAHISGATKTAMLCALGCEHTIIDNAYLKTDVRDLLRYMRGIGTHEITVSDGRVQFRRHNVASSPVGSPTTFALADCVSEVITYIALAVHTQIPLRLQVQDGHRVAQGLAMELDLLADMGIAVEIGTESISVRPADNLQPQHIEVTNDAIQSDHHPFFALMLLRGSAPSRIVEHVWRKRFAYVPELARLGGNLQHQDNSVTIHPSRLDVGHQVLKAADTRAAAMCLLAALTALGPTTIESCSHMDRGYADLVPALRHLGADITKIVHTPSEAASVWKSVA